MTEVVLILTVGLVGVSISQVLTIRAFLKHLQVIPTVPKKEKVEDDDVNQFETVKYVDLSEVSPEDGIKSIINK